MQQLETDIAVAPTPPTSRTGQSKHPSRRYRFAMVGLITLVVCAVFVVSSSAATKPLHRSNEPQPSALKMRLAYEKAAAEQAVADRERQIGDIVAYVKWHDEQAGAIVALVQANEAAQAAIAQAQPVEQPVTSVYSNSYPGDFLACVRNRESGGNYGIYNAGGSGAAGAYQFLPGTWNAIAASSGRADLVGVDPAQASPADQDAMAQALYAQQGAAPWGGGC